jgi:SAM-dependent methyltransferase
VSRAVRDWAARETCRLCDSHKLRPVVDLGETPLANEFPHEPAGDGPAQESFPLYLALCEGCGHVQLPVVVDPVRLFRDYVYVSGTSPVFVEHFRRYAAALLPELTPNDLVVEIGSNDGTLLRFFKEAGMRVLGIDPAVDIAERATNSGVPTWASFFDSAARRTIDAVHGKARLVVANNVFAHADDLAGIAKNVRKLLTDDGRFVFEVSYLGDVVDKCLFDTVYHEHLSYHSLTPLVQFLHRCGMWVYDAERVDTHGGSLRVTAVPIPHLFEQLKPPVCVVSPRAVRLVLEEADKGLHTVETLAGLQARITNEASAMNAQLRAIKERGGRIAGYGAPAKATTLLCTFGIADCLDFVVDDSPLKQGRWLPGGRVPVLPSGAIAERKPTHVLVLAWNFAESIREKLAAFTAAGGEIIVPFGL